MKEKEFYYTIEKAAQAEFKDRGSKFIAYVFPLRQVEEFKQLLRNLKKEHPKAAHHCFAYRIGTDGTVFRSGDDGEPAGTAGKPILSQIDSRQLTNVAVIVVRYFGGTLLGVPGLINAYKTAASFALQLSPIVQKPVEKEVQIQFDYTRLNEVMVVLKQYNCRVIEQQMQLFCTIKAAIPLNRKEEVLYHLNEIPHIEVAPTS